jgi:hypothetical protein
MKILPPAEMLEMLDMSCLGGNRKQKQTPLPAAVTDTQRPGTPTQKVIQAQFTFPGESQSIQ